MASHRHKYRASQVEPSEDGSSTRIRAAFRLPHIIVHRVECNVQETYHERHHPRADYLDVPCLLAQSSRMTQLQGQKPFAGKIEHYLEDHDELSFAICITYSCNRYHARCKDSFERLPMPAMDHDTAAAARPYFYILGQDASLADAESEALVLSPGLQTALDMLTSISAKFRWNWDEDRSNLTYPYLQLYHQKDLLNSAGTENMEPQYHRHLSSLRNYLIENLGPDYLEAEATFEQGLVEKRHWVKLFHIGTILVEFENDQPVARICTRTPILRGDELLLQCQFWDFDGKFYMRDITLRLLWPSDEGMVLINDLPAYPLKYAKSGLEDDIRARGRTFWDCRFQKLVSYDVWLDGIEVQRVIPHLMFGLWNFPLIPSVQLAIYD